MLFMGNENSKSKNNQKNQSINQKNHKSQEYVPPEKKKKTEEIELEIPKLIFTIMATKLKAELINKTHFKPEKQECKRNRSRKKKNICNI